MDSQVDQGSTFTVWLPLRPQDAAPDALLGDDVSLGDVDERLSAGVGRPTPQKMQSVHNMLQSGCAWVPGHALPVLVCCCSVHVLEWLHCGMAEDAERAQHATTSPLGHRSKWGFLDPCLRAYRVSLILPARCA